MTSAFADRLRDIEQGMRADANRTRGAAAALRQLGDDELARLLEGIASRAKDRATELQALRRSDVEETQPGIPPRRPPDK